MLEMMKEELNKTYTEKGDIAYKTTMSANLDFFASSAALRFDKERIAPLFKKAYLEDPKTALKNLLYLRDPRNGSGERELFRYALKTLIEIDPSKAELLLEYIPQFGRYDDLLTYAYTSLDHSLMFYIEKVLKEDLKHLEKDESVSLLAKWLPSINASNQHRNNLGRHIACKMGLSERNYRKILSKLRKGRIIENNLCQKDYSFDYEAVPSKALHKYRDAFERNDYDRYRNYLENVISGVQDIHADVLYPHEILAEVMNSSTLNEAFANEKWKTFVNGTKGNHTIVVRDGSGSMWGTPYDIATALAMLFAEKLEGQFHNHFITFSNNPQLVEIKGETLEEKVMDLAQYDDFTNTHLDRVYQLILNVASSEGFKKEDMIERIVIISDMEFDVGVRNVPTYETFKKRFEAIGYKIPTVVYWNVNARKIHFAAKPEPNIRFVAGASKNTIDAILNDETMSPIEFMNECLKRYNFIDEWYV